MRRHKRNTDFLIYGLNAGKDIATVLILAALCGAYTLHHKLNAAFTLWPRPTILKVSLCKAKRHVDPRLLPHAPLFTVNTF